MHLGLACLAATVLVVPGQTSTDDQVRQTIERSLPFLQTEGQRWIDDKKCVTCHQVPFMVWSLNAAADRGFAIDREKLQAWRTWATDWQHMASKQQLEQGERPTLAAQHDSVAQLLLGRSGHDRDASWPALFAECLAAGQLADGSWKAGGQLPGQRRPERETHEVTTMWAMVALQSYGSADESIRARLATARDWLGSDTVGQSTEWWATRVLLERADRTSKKAEQFRDDLVARQQPDGGWGWLAADKSDAFGTGVALYALARDGLSSDHSAIARARLFLINNQQPDGSWPVSGTKKGKADQVEPTATYWGTCWAVIGLAQTLPCSSAEK